MPDHQTFPFTAILGCDPGESDRPDDLQDLGLALVLSAIAPQIGGVLVRGEKGTAKSTAVRGLAEVLPEIEVYAGDRFSVDPTQPASSPDGPFASEAVRETRPVRLVELPVGATDDRVLGSLHLERALAHGAVEFEPGLLARAHRGILYVDEVNLLPDHLVDLLLDAAAMGQVQVERDSVSVGYPARFALIGTMNPEEGELRPQLLDRFGLTVEIAASRVPAERAEVVRRRIAFDTAPETFCAQYQPSQHRLRERLRMAAARVDAVQISDAALLKIAEICAAFEVDGLRADIVTARAAAAHAAWMGREAVTRDDIRRAATLTLPHRRRRNPFDAPGLDEDLLDAVLGDPGPPEPPEPPEPDGGPSAPPDLDENPEPQDDGPQHDGPQDDGPQHDGPQDDGPQDDGPRENGGPEGPGAADSALPSVPSNSGPEDGATSAAAAPDTVVSAAAPYRPRLIRADGLGAGEAGRRSRAIAARGRKVGAQAYSPTAPLHLVETMRTALGHQHARGRRVGPLHLRPDDFRSAVLEGTEANLVLFCVDASGSMAAKKRMVQVKAAILSLLLDAYRRRDKVGLITFRGSEAELALPCTRSVEIAATLLDELPAGGRTPLAEGLLLAADVLRRERIRDPQVRPLLVVVTDGRATARGSGGPVGADGADPVSMAMQAADILAEHRDLTTVVVDSESGPLRLGLAARLAAHLGAEHLPVHAVEAAGLGEIVRHRTQGVA